MNNIKIKRVFLLVLCTVLISFLAGCDKKSGGTIYEPEITADYLTGDYTQQLITDGAETMTGSVIIDKIDDETYNVHFEEKKIVSSPSSEEGFYIADTNIVKDAELGFDARIVCFNGESVDVSSIEDFVTEYQNDTEQIYNVYFLGDSVELITYLDPKEAF